MNKTIRILAGAVIILLGFFVWNRTTAPVPGERTVSEIPATEAVSDYEIETVVSGLDTIWSIVFTDSNRLLLTERPGQLRAVVNGVLIAEPIHTFAEVSESGEEGLMSLALHPDYANNRYIYASLAYREQGNLWVKVIRFRDKGNQIDEITTIFDRIPAARFHAGCRIAFGPDHKLYITTGEATDKQIAQDLDSLGGKILRINPDGTIPADNPFPDSPVWSYGHRNPQGIDWTIDGTLYASEHGPSVFDGPPGGDEINRIVKAGNYGWPLVSHERTAPDTIAPLVIFTPAEAPASLLAYSGAVFPDWQDNLFFGALAGEGIVRVERVAANPDILKVAEKIATNFGRIREVTEGPDGFIYFSTSNRDGRGDPAAQDDRILRIKPVGN